MAYPPAVTKKERRVLEIIRRGHPHRTMNVKSRNSTVTVNALEWTEIQIAAGLDASEFGDCIAHLGAGNLIDSARELPGVFSRLRGAKEKYFFWITQQGRRFLTETPIDALSDAPVPPSRAELKGSDIDDAVRIYENSLSKSPYVKPAEVAWTDNVLDDDVKGEIAKAAQELETMWTAFEQMFGHRGPAKAEREKEIRDPVVKRAAVRIFRAQDEQRRRLGSRRRKSPGRG